MVGMEMKIYNPYEFWNDFKNPNKKVTKKNKEAIEEIIRRQVSYLKKNIKDDKKIIDYGCGVGRTFECYNSSHDVTGIDISLLYKERVIRKANDLGVNFNWIHIKDNKIPFDNDTFDAVICSQVLMHTRPIDILNIMNEFKRVSKKVVVITIFGNEDNKYIDDSNYRAKYNKVPSFHYNFEKICDDYGYDMFNKKVVNKSIMFCYR